MSKFDVVYGFLISSVIVAVVSVHFIRQERISDIVKMEQQNQKYVTEILESMRQIQNKLNEMEKK